MRLHLTAAAVACCMTATAVAQNPPPPVIGNRANGKDYQPTPSVVIPREKATGVLPPPSQEKATDQELERIDKTLLREQGMSTKSVPDLTRGQ